MFLLYSSKMCIVLKKNIYKSITVSCLPSLRECFPNKSYRFRFVVNVNLKTQKMLYSLVKFVCDYIAVCELYGDPTVPVNRDHAKVCSPPLAYYFLKL